MPKLILNTAFMLWTTDQGKTELRIYKIEDWLGCDDGTKVDQYKVEFDGKYQFLDIDGKDFSEVALKLVDTNDGQLVVGTSWGGLIGVSCAGGTLDYFDPASALIYLRKNKQRPDMEIGHDPQASKFAIVDKPFWMQEYPLDATGYSYYYFKIGGTNAPNFVQVFGNDIEYASAYFQFYKSHRHPITP